MQLTSYQDDGVRFMLQRRATLLADEMGLGKSAQAITLVNRDIFTKNALVTCPAYLRFNWEREIEQWGHTAKKSFKIHSIDSLHLIQADTFDTVIVDEGHYIKNQSSQRYQNVEPLAMRAKRLVILTGTPVPNRVRELFALLCLLDPQRWNPKRISAFANIPTEIADLVIAKRDKPKSYSPNFLAFAKRYCGAKLVDSGKQPVWRNGKWETPQAYDFDGASNLTELNRILKETVMLRRTKAEVLKELPPKRRQLIVFPKPQTLGETDHIEVSEENYDEVVKRLEHDKVTFRKWSETRHQQGKDKVPFVLEFLHDMFASGVQKIIVFGHHIDVLEHLYASLQFDGAVIVHGAHSEEERKDAIDIFQDDPNCHFFVGSMGATGTGINLTSASHVVFSEFDPAPYRLTQCEDRAHRMGQKNMVSIYHTVWDTTLDARMAKIVVKKQEVINEVLR